MVFRSLSGTRMGPPYSFVQVCARKQHLDMANISHGLSKGGIDAAANDVYIVGFLPHPSAAAPDVIGVQTILRLSEPVKQVQWNPARLQCVAAVTLATEEHIRGTGSGVFLWDGDWEEERLDVSSLSASISGSAAVIAVPMGEEGSTLFPLGIG